MGRAQDIRVWRISTLPAEVRAAQAATHLPVELHSQDCVGVAVVANLGSFLEVADLQLSGSFEADNGHQAAGEQSLHNADIFGVS